MTISIEGTRVPPVEPPREVPGQLPRKENDGEPARPSKKPEPGSFEEELEIERARVKEEKKKKDIII